MAFAPSGLSDLLDHGFDTVIDVRSPSEFAEDHVPGAINLPVLNDEERAQVGTIYKQVSPFDARKLGAALVFRNASNHIEGPLAHHDGAWRPLVYCWRGGQRSGSFAWLLSEIGWRSEVIKGGYKAYRALVVDVLHCQPLPFRLVQLGGYTGTAKTALLHRLSNCGVQVLDLEGLANHRGSLLGDCGPQPAQKAFETRLAQRLSQFDPTRPVLVEAESSKIGRIILPPSLWDAMKSAPWIEVVAPIAARTNYLVREYDDILSDKAGLREKLTPLRAHRGDTIVQNWLALSAAGDKRALTKALMEEHYDLAYAKSMRALKPKLIARIEIAGFSTDDLAKATDQIEQVLQTTSI